MANGAAVKGTEELRNFNRILPPGAGVPGTEWFSQVELGVFITFVSLSNGCNALKRIRFRYSLEKASCIGSRTYHYQQKLLHCCQGYVQSVRIIAN